MALILKVLCPDCGHIHDSAILGAEIRCGKCGCDFRAMADGEGRARIISVTPDELNAVPYSQRSVELPVNQVSSIILADPALLADRLLRDVPVKQNAKCVGKVRLLKKLGQGGMGAVYRGYDESLLLDVAVKILPFPLDDTDHRFVERFRQEARISAKINHPNVVRTLQVDQQGYLLYLVMDYVEGQTARNLVDAKGPLMLPLALQIIHDVTRGVQAAHEHGVIHRDIKPDNILVATDGRVLLSDLGLAKAAATGSGSHMPVTRLGLLLGTPEYMSPEQWDIGATIGPASDLWSIGATFWMLLTHKPPYDEQDMPTLARHVKESPLPNIRQLRPNLPDSVVHILERCLAKRPEDRFADCEELLSAVNASLHELTGASSSFPIPKAMAKERAKIVAAQKTALAPVPVTIAPQAQAAPLLVSPTPTKTVIERIVWIALPFLAAAGGAFWMIKFYGETKREPIVIAAPIVSLDLRCATRVKPGEEAELIATVVGVEKPSDYIVQWAAGERVYSSSSIRVPLRNDTDFVVSVRDKNSGVEVARKDARVRVELQVRAAEKDFQRLETGNALRLEGQVCGGPRSFSDIETRWVEQTSPEKTLIKGLTFSIPALEIGRHTFVLQAKRVEYADWTQAATDKVVVEVVKHIPTEFKTAMQQALETRQNAAKAVSGAEAVALWKKALASLEQALISLPDADDARAQIEECRKQLVMDEKYLALLDESRALKAAAEMVPETDSVRRLSAWSEALQPCAGALALFDREEARAQTATIQVKVAELKSALEAAERERDLFDTLIAKARYSVKEAKKYVNPTVALPHWENSLTSFQELRGHFPKRADEFVLELKETQENRDKAYLYDNFGVVPAKP
ncbi:MAG: serine/threonine-protein kinase [Planctomycetota bacterium]